MNQFVSMTSLLWIVSCIKHTYINKLSLCDNVYMYWMAYGSAVGSLTFIRKINQSLLDHEKHNAHPLVQVTEALPKCATRDIKKTSAKCSPMVLRSIFRELTEYSSAASSSNQTGVHFRVAQFFSLQMTQTSFWT